MLQTSARRTFVEGRSLPSTAIDQCNYEAYQFNFRSGEGLEIYSPKIQKY